MTTFTRLEVAGPGESPQIVGLTPRSADALRAITKAKPRGKAATIEPRIGSDLIKVGVPIKQLSSGRWVVINGAMIRELPNT